MTSTVGALLSAISNVVDFERNRTRIVITCFAMVSIIQAAFAAQGDLDPMFGDGGRVLLGLGGSHDFFNTVNVLPTGKLLVAGSGVGNRSVLLRLLSNGQVDPSYATGGVLVAPGSAFGAYSHAFNDGSAILAYYRTGADGLPGFAVSRISAEGVIDNAFGVAGLAFLPSNWSSRITGLEVDGGGNIYIIGQYLNGNHNDWLIGKFTPGGVLDPTFGTGGVVITNFGRPGIADPQDFPATVKIDSNNRLVVGGATSTDQFQSTGNILHAIARYTPMGQLDVSFNGDGKAVFGFDSSVFDREYVSDIEFLTDGDILLASAGGSDTALVRLNDNGSFETQFGNGGVLSFSYRSPLADPRDIRVDSLGRILLVGDSYQPGSTATNFAIGRILADGTPDKSFANGGKIETFGVQYSSGYGFDFQPDGMLVAVGIAGQASPTNDFCALVARYDAIPEPAATLLFLLALPAILSLRSPPLDIVLNHGR